MQYRKLGRTGIKVSEIGIGGEGFENKSFFSHNDPELVKMLGTVKFDI